MAERAVRVRVTGRVQGVNFRAWAMGEAERLGLSGWVRNEADGSVSGLIAGESAAVEAMIARLHQGPRAAMVTDVEVSEAEAETDGLKPTFRILR